MRRMLIAAAVLCLGLAARTCQAGGCDRNDCGRPVCNPIPQVADKLGFSYFYNHSNPCLSGQCQSSKCPQYIYPNRAPRDFWMLR